jgi:hypothetical protein
MDPDGYTRYLDRLVASLAADDRVIGVVGLGSTARRVRQPDEWSDHDLWIVVRPGSEDWYRTDPSWLPDHHDLVLWMRETRHGMKALYESGHLVEVAVFRPDELSVTRAGDHRVYLDRGDVAGALRGVRERTRQEAAPGRSSGFLAGQFLTNLLVGVGRYARGELIGGHEFVKVHAVGHLLELVALAVPPARPEAVDDLNPWRRVEIAFPEPGRRIAAALRADLPEAALALLEVAETMVVRHLDEWPAGAARVVRRVTAKVLAGEGAR